MFVASESASGDQAVMAVLPHIIGSISTCVGGGTLSRTGDVVIQVMAGDAVCEGDVIETASDGQIAISLLDGTCFMLSHDTRVVLRGLPCDPDGALPSACFAVDRGSFAFVAGPTAKTGSLRIDTPLGNIRGRAHAGGFGMLSLTALTFATMSDVNAADPDATFLDDDAIAYKDFEHGAFELWTKEAIPRLIVVGDPGETVVLTKRGSSVNISQFANSAARMEELQAAQQAVLSNYARGYGPGGSSTPSYLDLPKLQPTNLVQPGGSTAQGQLPPLPEVPSLVEPVIPPPPIPKPPMLDAATGPTLIDTATLDHFVASGGQFVANSSAAGATLTFGISGGTADNTVLEGVTYDTSIAGLYGTLYLNSATGAFVYVPDDAAINALSAPTTESFTITVSDGTLSVSQVYTVILNGVNDAAIITGAASGANTEAGGIANAAPGAPTASGTLFNTDVDNPANTFTVVSSPTPSHQGYGRFTMTMAGEWTYALDNTNPAVQALNVGDTLTDTFTVTTVDGTPQVITITITGSNDAAVISGATTGAVAEAGTATPGPRAASGTLTAVDVDNPSNSFTAVTSKTASHQGYGSFTITAAGVWTYTLDNCNPAVQALNAGETLTDTFTVATIDGTTQLVTITITGANDAAIISGTITGSVTEAGSKTAGTPVATGTLTASDADNAANTFAAVSSPTASQQGYGHFTMTAAGVWTYTLDNSNPAVQALNVGATLIDTFTVATVDGTTQIVTITIAGRNDAAVISGTTTGSVVEAGSSAPGTPVATGTLTDIDVDNAANTFTAVSSPTTSHQGYGCFTMTASGVWTYTLDNCNPAVQALNAGETLTDTFTVATIDGTTQVVTITITGSNDAAIIFGTITGSVTEASSTTAGTPIATGTLAAADADNSANAFTAVSSPTASQQGYGHFTMTAAGVWTYTLDNADPAVQALNAGGTLTDTFTVTTVDGTSQLVTIIIRGVNDAAVISGTTSGLVTEAGSTAPGTPVATGTLTDLDVDNADNSFTAVTSPTASHQGYGSFTMTASGVWTYTLNNANPAVQALNAGDALTDTFTVKTVDGTTQLVTISITGSNDAAVISGTKTGSVVEAGSSVAGTPTATGTLTDTDVDNADNAFIAVSSPTVSHNGYGSFTMTATGVWIYTLDNSNPVVQALNVGATLTDTFTVSTLDGTTQVVTINIGGSNDAAVISGTTTGSVTEAGTTTPGTPVATGTLTDIDVDNEDNKFTAITSPTASKGGYGTFTITAAGVWAYTLDDGNGAVQALDPGQTLTDTFTVTTIDGTPQTVTIVIHGSSDADPNDFDNLALGDHVITNPPYVYGTPNGETIAGGGDKFQIVYAGAGNDTVNGTGKDDILYSGSGNDTIKGNDGKDTIYGGSGNDTVNGNNGDDTITGGFGADRLTGSNGNDIFVYLSVADSNSKQFDTITDFASGSDKINLAALGALAFLHLSSTAAPVPPRTIAWIYDSASNETIVYVNPTDVARNIGDSALLEIHLQGIVSVQESDFIYQAATNTVAAAAEAIDLAPETIAVTDGAMLATDGAETSAGSAEAPGTDATWSLALQTADEGFKFDFERDISSTGSVRLARFGDAPAYVAAEGEAATAVAETSASPAELWSQYTGTPTENHFTFHQELIQTSISTSASAASVTAILSAVSAIELASLMVTNAVASSQPLEYASAPGAGAEHHVPQHQPHTVSHQTSTNNSHATANAFASWLTQLGITPGPGANHSQPQHEPHIASPPAAANEPHWAANPVAASQLAQFGVTPGPGLNHSQPQHEPPMAAQLASASEPHAAANAVAASQLAQLGITPGPGANHSQPQHEPPMAAQQASASEPHAAANAVAASQLAQLGVMPGPGANHSQPQHEPPMAAQQASASEPHAAANPASAANAAAASQLAQLETPASSASQQQPHHAASPQGAANDPPSASAAPADVGASHPSASANVSQGPPASDPSYGSSFHFNNEFAAANTEPLVPLEIIPAPASTAHGHGAGPGGPATILETAMAPPPPAWDPAAHANGHGHGPHELLV